MSRQSVARSALPTAVPSAPLLQRKCACGGSPGPSGECAECRKKRLGLQRKEAGAAPAVAPPIVHEVLRSPGRPLEGATRSFMESRLGHDFGRVRVHTDATAAESARAVCALAYTVGPQIVFGAGQYSPGTERGKHLLAHELAHVIQQRGSTQASREGGLAVSLPDDVLEAKADSAARAAIGSGPPLPSGGSGGLRLQRTPDEEEPTRGQRRGDPLPYREATELLECIRIMGDQNAAYCRQQVLGEAPPTPPFVRIRSASLATGVNLEFGPRGTGSFTLQLRRPGTSHTLATGPRSAGLFLEAFNIPGLPQQEFTELRAIWNVDGTDHEDTRPFHIKVLGMYRHSQYNVPHESTCGGGPVPAFITDSSCHFTPTTLRSTFLSQTRLNGSGVSIAHGNLVLENFCVRPGHGAPAGAAGRSFRRTGAFQGACRQPLNNSTVAACQTHPDLHCGNRVFLHTVGTKTVTDFCPACCGHDQLDNFTTAAACSGIVDLGRFITIKIF